MQEFLTAFEPVILGIHFFVSIFLVIVILLQAGKGADIGATFGAGSNQGLFGARGAATFLSKLTGLAAAIFLLTSLSLTYLHRSGSDSVIGKDDGKGAVQSEKTQTGEVKKPKKEDQKNPTLDQTAKPKSDSNQKPKAADSSAPDNTSNSSPKPKPAPANSENN